MRVNLSSHVQPFTKKKTTHGTRCIAPPSFRRPFAPPLRLRLLSRFSLVSCSGSFSSVLPSSVRNKEGSLLPVLVARKYYLFFPSWWMNHGRGAGGDHISTNRNASKAKNSKPNLHVNPPEAHPTANLRVVQRGRVVPLEVETIVWWVSDQNFVLLKGQQTMDSRKLIDREIQKTGGCHKQPADQTRGWCPVAPSRIPLRTLDRQRGHGSFVAVARPFSF